MAVDLREGVSSCSGVELRTIGNWFWDKRNNVSDIEEDRELEKKKIFFEGLERSAKISGDF